MSKHRCPVCGKAATSVGTHPRNGYAIADCMCPDTDLFGHPALERRASDGLTRADGGSDEWVTLPSIIAPRCLRPALVAYGSADARVLADAPLAGHYVRGAA